MFTHPKVVQALCSVDWLTMTVKRSQARNDLSKKAYDFLEESIETGSDVGQWEKHGYTGWYCNGARWGRRDADDLMQLSSDTAGHYWLEYLALADNVSRIDLAVTLKFDQNNARLVAKQFEQLKEESERTKLICKYSRTEGLKEGYTLYVGSRSSAQFGRLYDKQAESHNAEHWLNCLRWEVEFKKPLAWEVAQNLASSPHRDQLIYQRVYGWFTDRYVYVPDLGSAKVAPLAIPRKVLPDDKRLAWLARQVRPTVEKLQARGLDLEVKKALGILDNYPE